MAQPTPPAEDKAAPDQGNKTELKRTDAEQAKNDSSAKKGSSNEGEQQEEDGRFFKHDRLTDLKAAMGPLQPTVDDPSGIERIVGPAVEDSWEPARVEPHPDDIARGEEVKAFNDARREERLGATQAPGEKVKDGAGVARGAMEAERS